MVDIKDSVCPRIQNFLSFFKVPFLVLDLRKHYYSHYVCFSSMIDALLGAVSQNHILLLY